MSDELKSHFAKILGKHGWYFTFFQSGYTRDEVIEKWIKIQHSLIWESRNMKTLLQRHGYKTNVVILILTSPKMLR